MTLLERVQAGMLIKLKFPLRLAIYRERFLQGTQSQLGYLPKAVAHNDFIFSVIAEETGFIGSSFVIGLFSLIIANGIRISGMAKDSFGSQLAIGISVLFFSAFFHQYRNGHWNNAYYGTTASFFKLRRLFCLKLFYLQGIIQSIYRYRKDFS